MVFVTVEILAEDQIVLEQLARCALYPVLDVVRPAGGVASIELRLGEGREHAGEQTEDICGIGVVDAIVAAERSAGNVAMRVDRGHVRGAHAAGRIALFVASDDERGAAEGPIDVSPRRRRRTFKPSLDVPEGGPAEGARVDRSLIHS